MSDQLTKLYVELTTACNLDCAMCVQRVWQEPTGRMPLATFAALMEDVGRLPQPPTIHLSGYGEPMCHAHFLEIVRLAKATVGGAGQLAEDAAEDPGQLRINVTSPNGTTQAALEVLMDQSTGFPALLRRAVKAAADRSRALGRG